MYENRMLFVCVCMSLHRFGTWTVRNERRAILCLYLSRYDRFGCLMCFPTTRNVLAVCDDLSYIYVHTPDGVFFYITAVGSSDITHKNIRTSIYVVHAPDIVLYISHPLDYQGECTYIKIALTYKISPTPAGSIHPVSWLEWRLAEVQHHDGDVAGRRVARRVQPKEVHQVRVLCGAFLSQRRRPAEQRKGRADVRGR